MEFEFKTQECICPKCGKIYVKRYVPYIKLWVGECQCVIDEKKADEEKRLEFQKKRRIDENIANSGIPKLYTNSSFDNFEIRCGTENAYKVSKIYAETFSECTKDGKGLIFVGNTGSGKTHLAIAIAHSILDNGLTVKFTSVGNLQRDINSADDYGFTEAKLIKTYSTCRLLIIDDICVADIGNKIKRILFDIIDNRVNYVKPTIFTTNISDLEEIKEKLNEQIYDRIVGNCKKINVFADSYRRKK